MGVNSIKLFNKINKLSLFWLEEQYTYGMFRNLKS